MSDEMPQGKATVSDEDIIIAIKTHPDPFIVASELADEFDHTRQWAHSRLQDLHEQGRVNRKNGGERSVIWWID